MARLTKLSRPVIRKLPDRDLVVELARDGISIRRLRQTASVYVPWHRLLATFAPPARSRREAFQRAAAPGWVPTLGEWVWLDRDVSRESCCRVVRVTEACGGPLVRVRRTNGHEAQYSLAELRPAPSRDRETTDR